MTRTYEEYFTPEVIESIQKAGLIVPTKDKISCCDCPDRDTCEFAWDLYNTDGDCLAEK